MAEHHAQKNYYTGSLAMLQRPDTGKICSHFDSEVQLNSILVMYSNYVQAWI